jgi:hypothetical protein
MNNQISESIFSNGRVTIPMMDVSHIEHLQHLNKPNGISLIMKNTHWDVSASTWANDVYLYEHEKQDFLSAWCRFRSEYEAALLSALSTSSNQVNKE